MKAYIDVETLESKIADEIYPEVKLALVILRYCLIPVEEEKKCCSCGKKESYKNEIGNVIGLDGYSRRFCESCHSYKRQPGVGIPRTALSDIEGEEKHECNSSTCSVPCFPSKPEELSKAEHHAACGCDQS